MKKLLAVVLALGLTSMAANAALITNYVGGTSSPSLPQIYAGGFYSVPSLLDFSVTTVASNDIVKMVSVPSGCVVVAVSAVPILPLTNQTATFDVGSGATVGSYILGSVATNAVVSFTNGPVAYQTGGYIGLRLMGGASNATGAAGSVGKILVKAYMLNGNP